MGEGSQASKTVAGLVLENNNFALLPETLEEGRTIVRNLRRSAKLFLVKNVYSLILILAYASGWFGIAVPLRAAAGDAAQLAGDRHPGPGHRPEPRALDGSDQATLLARGGLVRRAHRASSSAWPGWRSWPSPDSSTARRTVRRSTC